MEEESEEISLQHRSTANRNRRRAARRPPANYEDVFGGPPKHQAAGFVPATGTGGIDYKEVFGGVSASCSIPYLDLNLGEVDGWDCEKDEGTNGVDYGDIFGRYEFSDFAVPYEELFERNTRDEMESTVPSSNGRSSFQNRSESIQSEEENNNNSIPYLNTQNQDAQFSLNPLNSDEIAKEYNTSYNKSNQNQNQIKTTKIIPQPKTGFSFVLDDKNDIKNLSSSSIEFTPNIPFLNITDDINLHPNPIPAPLPPQPKFLLKSKLLPQQTNEIAPAQHERVFTKSESLPPNFVPEPVVPKQRLKTRAFLKSDSLPTNFEMDASSASLAMKEAMEFAQARLKTAKEMMDRKKEGKITEMPLRRFATLPSRKKPFEVEKITEMPSRKMPFEGGEDEITKMPSTNKMVREEDFDGKITKMPLKNKIIDDVEYSEGKITEMPLKKKLVQEEYSVGKITEMPLKKKPVQEECSEGVGKITEMPLKKKFGKEEECSEEGIGEITEMPLKTKLVAEEEFGEITEMPLKRMTMGEDKDGKWKSDDEFYELTSIGGAKTEKENKVVEKPGIGVLDLEAKHNRKKWELNPGLKILEKVEELKDSEKVEKEFDVGDTSRGFVFSLREGGGSVLCEERENGGTDEERERVRKLEEEREMIRKLDEERESVRKLEEREKARLLEEERERVRKLDEERENVRILEEERESVRKLEEEKENARKLEEERENARKLEERENVRKMEEERENALKLEEERETVMKMEKEREEEESERLMQLEQAREMERRIFEEREREEKERLLKLEEDREKEEKEKERQRILDEERETERKLQKEREEERKLEKEREEERKLEKEREEERERQRRLEEEKKRTEQEREMVRKLEEERERVRKLEKEREVEREKVRKLEEQIESHRLFKEREQVERERKLEEEREKERERLRLQKEREEKDKTKLEAEKKKLEKEERERASKLLQIEKEKERREKPRKSDEEREARKEKLAERAKEERERAKRLEEEREREREREKDRLAVERATQERAERIAIERITAAKQRASSEVRDKDEIGIRVSNNKNDNLGEKNAREARIRAERAAVERATQEVRERAMEKLKSFNDLNKSGDSESEKDAIFKRTKSESSLTKNEDESSLRHKARLERQQRTSERAVKALAEKNRRDFLAQREKTERDRIAEHLDAEVKRWSNGKEGNLRALLSTLQYILGHDSGWQPIPLTEVITAINVKKAYRKATLYVHPDKLQQRGASIHQKYICEKVFDLLKEAWNKFNSEER